VLDFEVALKGIMIVRDPAANGGMLYEVYFDLDLIKIVSSQLYIYFFNYFNLELTQLDCVCIFLFITDEMMRKNIWNATCI